MRGMLFALALLAAGTVTPAGAQTYVGVSAGQSDAKDSCIAGLTCDFKDTSYKVFAGHMVRPYAGVELAYVDLGTVSYSDGVDQLDIQNNGFALWAKGALPVGNLSLFAKAGVAYLDTKAQLVGVGRVYESKTGFAWGAGASLYLTGNLGARIEYERFQPEFLGDKVDVDLISAGVLWRF